MKEKQNVTFYSQGENEFNVKEYSINLIHKKVLRNYYYYYY